jgi:hypothetical protein
VLFGELRRILVVAAPVAALTSRADGIDEVAFSPRGKARVA